MYQSCGGKDNMLIYTLDKFRQVRSLNVKVGVEALLRSVPSNRLLVDLAFHATNTLSLSALQLLVVSSQLASTLLGTVSTKVQLHIV